ncbi:MAG: FAD-dependent oxidoreductase [Candidatus Bathyarchaeota archaeon]|nr:FAD-dependent oxidoreductase [Candidatus Bathyarchaeota archaeon]
MKIIVVGSGAGGATAARELSAQGHEVLVMEAGRPFQPFTHLGWAQAIRGTGLLGGEGTINHVFPHMNVLRSSEDLVLVRGLTTGGSTTISCGNAVRAENGLNEIGLDLSEEYGEIEELLKPAAIPRSRWRPVTQSMFDSAAELGLKPTPTPKMVDVSKCASCGLCELGCKTGARWDSRMLFKDIEARRGRIQTGSRVQRVIIEEGRVRGVEVSNGSVDQRIEADAVVLAAGGIGTAQILAASGIPPRDSLWADVVLTLGGVLKDAGQFSEAPMAWYVKRPDYILSPYPDILSHLFHKPWRGVSQGDRVGVMVKLAEDQNGSVNRDGRVRKELTATDRALLDEGMEMAKTIMVAAGVGGPFVRGMLNGGHLGGTAPLSRDDVRGMRPAWLPEGLWVADLSLLPKSQGLPTIMTTMALALRVSRKIGSG